MGQAPLLSNAGLTPLPGSHGRHSHKEGAEAAPGDPLAGLLEAGMDVAGLDLAHGTVQQHGALMRHLRQVKPATDSNLCFAAAGGGADRPTCLPAVPDALLTAADTACSQRWGTLPTCCFRDGPTWRTVPHWCCTCSRRDPLGCTALLSCALTGIGTASAWAPGAARQQATRQRRLPSALPLQAGLDVTHASSRRHAALTAAWRLHVCFLHCR